ncbi:MerR family transcriptional regulator [Haliangium sp.]|uniref:helix-turn-helix domain-containing protein n=1 Tax=Haliangium sp. TaxID=2663208 RepID=UPI003D0B88BD
MAAPHDTRPDAHAELRAALAAALERDDLTIDELVGETDRFLRALAPAQSRYKVRDRPDVRTIRYYTSQSLLPKPTGYRGGRARYTGSHLLRLLYIKKLQAEHHTLQQIARRLARADDQAVLAALQAGLGPASGAVARPAPAPSVRTEHPAADPAPSPSGGRDPGRPARVLDLPVADAPPPPAGPAPDSPLPTGTRLTRVALPGGAALDLPESALDDPHTRRQLADALIDLARALRADVFGEAP